MSNGPSVSRLHEHSFFGIGASILAATLAGLLTAVVGAPSVVQGTVTAGAAGLPAAIEYFVRGRKRDKAEDEARIEQGEFRRPINLVVTMFVAVTAGGLFLGDTILGFVLIRSAKAMGMGPTGTGLLGILAALVIGAGGFFLSSYTSHYLGRHPYTWVAVGVGCALVLRWVQVLSEMGLNIGRLIGSIVLYAVFLGFCHAGVWFGLRRHDAFLAKKLVRARRSAARDAATQRMYAAVKQPAGEQFPPPNPRDRRLE